MFLLLLLQFLCLIGTEKHGSKRVNQDGGGNSDGGTSYFLEGRGGCLCNDFILVKKF